MDGASYVVLEPGGSSASHCNDVTADLSAGVASGVGFGTDTLRGVENLASGGGNDSLTGDGHANTFYVGNPCPDALAQQDYVVGGDGSDRIDFNSDFFDYGSSFGAVVVDLAAGTAEQESPYSETDVRVALDSIENVSGSGFEDVILGDDGPNRLSAGPGSRLGGDLIRGGAGDDVLSGPVGSDRVFGDEGSDKLFGDTGNDHLDGGAGSNRVDGGRGRDSCLNPDRDNGAINCEA